MAISGKGFYFLLSDCRGAYILPRNDIRTKMTDIILYHFEACPYCIKVRDYLEQQGIQIPMKDTRLDEAAYQELIQIGGSSQVPCLVIDGKALYESDDIIEWFEHNLKP